MREIGSEYWLSDDVADPVGMALWENWPGLKRYYVSGRTALSAILDDIVRAYKQKRTLTAYLPSYCCHTMIEPFLRHKIKVDFYPVLYRDGVLIQEIDAYHSCDVVLTLDYFGYQSTQVQLPRNAIAIRDMTHSLFAHYPDTQNADYMFASFRKWGTIAGAAIACKRIGEWQVDGPSAQYGEYISLRNQGYSEKAAYMAGKQLDKGFLSAFSEAEARLEADYLDYDADPTSILRAGEISSYAKARKENAKVLFEGLYDSRLAEPLFSTLGEYDVPLFVPVFVRGNMRDALGKYLIENNIYCPVHWPLSDIHQANEEEKKIYLNELSLVCDQRYDISDMQREIDCVKRFENENA